MLISNLLIDFFPGKAFDGNPSRANPESIDNGEVPAGNRSTRNAHENRTVILGSP
jgi:hypothetical protein